MDNDILLDDAPKADEDHEGDREDGLEHSQQLVRLRHAIPLLLLILEIICKHMYDKILNLFIVSNLLSKV